MKIIKVGAIWCSGCLVMKPRWRHIEADYPNLQTTYYDVDADADLIKKHNIDVKRMPTFIFLDKAGKELTRVTGEVEEKTLREFIKKYENS